MYQYYKLRNALYSRFFFMMMILFEEFILHPGFMVIDKYIKQSI